MRYGSEIQADQRTQLGLPTHPTPAPYPLPSRGCSIFHLASFTHDLAWGRFVAQLRSELRFSGDLQIETVNAGALFARNGWRFA